MRAIKYALRQGWSGLWRTRGASVFAVAAIALAIVVLGALLLVTWNAQQLMARWTSAAEFSVFLRDDATSDQRGAIEAALDRSGVARGHEYVSKADAIARFRREFSELSALTAGLDANPFPASIEVQLDPQVQETARINVLLQSMAAMPGVADVRYDREWLDTFSTGLRAVRGAGLTLAVLVALAAAVTVAAVVRLGLDSRRDEIEIMELVGAPLAFIRGPFVGEGILQGGIGALLALLILWLGFLVARAWWGADLTAALNGATLGFLPVNLCALLVAGGMAVGGAGGFAASLHAG